MRHGRLLKQVASHYSYGHKQTKENFVGDTAGHVPQPLCLSTLVSLCSRCVLPKS